MIWSKYLIQEKKIHVVIRLSSNQMFIWKIDTHLHK